MKSIFIDTSVLVYAYDQQTPCYTRSVELIQGDQFDVYVGMKNIVELCCVLSKQHIDRPSILRYCREIMQNTTVLYETSLSRDIFTNLCTIHKPQGNRVFDIQIVSIAKAHGIDTIATFNTKDFVDIEGIELIN